ncbi:MAG TPA: penicillin acylase family protein [Ktedonobacterales bacterium]|nr:penicillin acylase family protein [Ktedonobacterales bacterium]
MAAPAGYVTRRPGDEKPRPKRTPLRRLARALVFLLVAVVILTGALSAGAFIYVLRTLPQTSGTITVAGLDHPASVLRDQWGVPHITAATLHDVAFTQGYVTAQDRLFQMEFNRRVAQGRLAEMFGPGPHNSLIQDDEFLRTLGLYRSATNERAGLALSDTRTLGELQAYADGVNAFLNSHKSSLPPEFTILGITLAPWTVMDSLAYGRVVALSLDNQWYTKYARAMVLAKVGPALTNTLFPTYPTTNPTLFTSTLQANDVTSTSNQSASLQRATPTLSAAALTNPAFARLAPSVLQNASAIHSLLGSITDALGSNDWVVDGTRTATGKPLLANDPHLGINMPSIWYEIGLRGPAGMDAIGFSFPGVPGIVIGHNAFIAWGVTNVGADDTDLYLETLDPANHPGQYEDGGQWLALTTRQETINVRGASPITITVQATRHGPLLNSVVDDLKHTQPVALKWTALQEGYTFSGFFQLDFATSWDEFNAAIDNISISQNFVYADTAGNIGYRMSGLLPLRPAANDFVPVDGATAANDWTGYVPQNQMPRLFDPPTHIIATANNQITPTDAPVYVTWNWDQGYRARRIVDDLLATPQLTIAGYERIQADAYNVPAATLAPIFVAAGSNAGGDAAQAAHLLQGWNDEMSTSSAAAAVYEVTVGMLIRETLEPLLGKSLYGIYRDNYSSSGLYTVLLNLLAVPTPPFFGMSFTDLGTTPKRDAAIAHALTDAMSQLRAQLGPDTSTWRWGALHQAHFNHPLASVRPLDRVFGTTPVATSGDTVTVSVGGDGGFTSDPPSYDQHTVSSMREIIDLSNLDNSLWITTTGESGEPFSAHYSDLIPLWAAHQYQRMDYSPEAEAHASTDLLVLKP